MEKKRFLVTDTVGKMEMFYEDELALLKGFKEFERMTVQEYREDIVEEYENDFPLEISNLDKVPF